MNEQEMIELNKELAEFARPGIKHSFNKQKEIFNKKENRKLFQKALKLASIKIEKKFNL